MITGYQVVPCTFCGARKEHLHLHTKKAVLRALWSLRCSGSDIEDARMGGDSMECEARRDW